MLLLNIYTCKRQNITYKWYIYDRGGVVIIYIIYLPYVYCTTRALLHKISTVKEKGYIINYMTKQLGNK